MICNPDKCPNCQYIGEGDSYCDAIGEIVLDDWIPTEHYMGLGCPFAQAKKTAPKKRNKKRRQK